MNMRTFSPLDHWLVEAQRGLDTVFGNPPARRANPATDTPEVALDPAEQRHAAGLMRINHVGEVCAQGLYFGQAAVARDPATRAHLLDAARIGIEVNEETGFQFQPEQSTSAIICHHPRAKYFVAR